MDDRERGRAKIERRKEGRTMGNGRKGGEWRERDRERCGGSKEKRRGEPQTESETEEENAPPLRSFSVLLALACVKCKAAG